MNKFGRIDEAIDCYNKLIVINPNDANSYFQRGCLLMEKDKNDSLSDFTKAIELYIGKKKEALKSSNEM